MISVENVTFGYNRRHPVLDGFSLPLPERGVCGLLGRNGTGKSTLLHLMAGLLRPSHGRVLVDGVEARLRRADTLARVYLLGEECTLPRITLLRYVEALRPFYPRFSDEGLRTGLSAFGLPADVHMGELSMGQRKKVCVSLALAAGARYLLMDEPTNGLDILAKSQFRRAVVGAMCQESLLVVSTHQAHDVELLLDHVTIIGRNRVLHSAPVAQDRAPEDLEQLFVRTVAQAGEAGDDFRNDNL